MLLAYSRHFCLRLVHHLVFSAARTWCCSRMSKRVAAAQPLDAALAPYETALRGSGALPLNCTAPTARTDPRRWEGWPLRSVLAQAHAEQPGVDGAQVNVRRQRARLHVCVPCVSHAYARHVHMHMHPRATHTARTRHAHGTHSPAAPPAARRSSARRAPAVR